MKTRLLICATLFFFYMFGLYAPTALSRRGKSLQSEAKQALGLIAKFEDAYLSEFDRYTDDLDQLELNPIHGKAMKYQYEITVSPDGKEYVATARSRPDWSPYLLDSKEIGMDTWEIDQDLALKNTVNGAAQLSMITPLDLFFFWGLPLVALADLVYTFVRKRNAAPKA